LTAIALDGLATAAQIKRELSIEVEKLRGQGITPGLGTLLVGDDPGSHSYVGEQQLDLRLHTVILLFLVLLIQRLYHP